MLSSSLMSEGCQSSSETLRESGRGTRAGSREGELEIDSCEPSLAASCDARKRRWSCFSFMTDRVARLTRRSLLLFGPFIASSSLSASRSTLELSCADVTLPRSSASRSFETAASTLPLQSSNACLIVLRSARKGNDELTTSIIHGRTKVCASAVCRSFRSSSGDSAFSCTCG